MARVSGAVIVVCLATVLLGIHGKTIQKRAIQQVDWNEYIEYYCTHGYVVYPSYLCNPYTTTTTATGTTTLPTTTANDDDNNDDGDMNLGNTTSTTSTQSTSSDSSSTTAVSGSPLEHAHWCQLNNGSYLSLDQKFIYDGCSFCQCTESHTILCTNFQCMSTYCIDDSTPVTRDGQCCPQCAYETTSNTCVLDGYAFPTGILLRRTTDDIQCWCTSGVIECRKSSSSLGLSSLDYMGEGTGVYVIIIVIVVVLLLGTLLCCGGGLFFYYYYYKNQQTVQDAYAQYYSNAGWQEMGEDGQVVVDGVAEEKQTEAEQQQQYQYEQQYPTGQSAEYIPPPYAIYNGSHQQNGKEQQYA